MAILPLLILASICLSAIFSIASVFNTIFIFTVPSNGGSSNIGGASSPGVPRVGIAAVSKPSAVPDSARPV